MRTALHWLLTVVCAASAPSAAAAQLLPGEVRRLNIQDDLRQYRALIADYRRGNTDVLDRLLDWDKLRIREVLAAIETTHDDLRLWGPARFQAAAMMHTDLARRFVERSDMEAALPHLDVAAQLLKQAGPDVHGYAGRWCLAVARLQRSADIEVAERFLESCRGRWPRNPAILLESGLLQELLATDTQRPDVVYLPDLKSAPPRSTPNAVDAAVPLTRNELEALHSRRVDRLNKAAQWLGESLRRDPANQLTRLRLGRVQMLRNRNDAALSLLKEAAASKDDHVSYLAQLFAGAVHEQRGQLAAAAAAYRAAVDRFPQGHAAHVALSAVLHRSGQQQESRAILARILDAAPAAWRDPWWSYFTEPPNANRERFEELRREVQQQ